jgi:hypothetical protein
MERTPDRTRLKWGPRPGTATITDRNGENPQTFTDCVYPHLSDAAREYYNAQRREANA